MGTEEDKDCNGTPGKDSSQPQPISQLLFFQCGSTRVPKGGKLLRFSVICGKPISSELKRGRIRKERKHENL